MVPNGMSVDQATINYQQGPETNSQAVANYAGAALLVGCAFMAVGMGVGFLVDSFKDRKKRRGLAE